MAKRKAAGRSKQHRKPIKRASARKAKVPKRIAKTSRKRVAKGGRKKKAVKAKSPAKAVRRRPLKSASRPKPAVRPKANSSRAVVPAVHVSRVERERRILADTVPTPPSSLDMDRRGSSVRTGRIEMAEARANLGAMSALTAGDVDADATNAYFSGDEAPGGDNPTPDQDVVDDIGKALGLAYQDNEELRPEEKVSDRDRHRWELDPASSEDYKDRK